MAPALARVGPVSRLQLCIHDHLGTVTSTALRRIIDSPHAKVKSDLLCTSRRLLCFRSVHYALQYYMATENALVIQSLLPSMMATSRRVGFPASLEPCTLPFRSAGATFHPSHKCLSSLDPWLIYGFSVGSLKPSCIILCLITFQNASGLHVDSFETVSNTTPSRFSYG